MKIKRIYESPAPEDGYRVLIDRLWPRGISKMVAVIDEWNKDIAPSSELRNWFSHQPEKFQDFALAYQKELQTKMSILECLKEIDQQQNVTLLYAAKDSKINHAVVLLHVIENL